jgi:AAA ATPase domain
VLRGRDRETQVLGELISRARGGHGGALVVRGEAGIGKTSLLEWTVESAAGFRALRAAGAEFEMELAFAGLHALCGPLLDARDRLPGPQREALDVAFGLRSGGAPDPLRTGMAVLTLLSDAAEQGPVICVVDDAQWLDRASAQALAFAARRIASDAVAMVLGVREPLMPGELVAMPDIVVEGLAEAEARALLVEVLPVRLDEQVVDRILAEARGNPLALRELVVNGPPGQLAAASPSPCPGVRTAISSGGGSAACRRTHDCCCSWRRQSRSAIRCCSGTPPGSSGCRARRQRLRRRPGWWRSARESGSTTRSCGRRSIAPPPPRSADACTPPWPP